jgi:hypothetical protein
MMSDCRIATDCRNLHQAQSHVGVRLQPSDCRIARIVVLSLSLYSLRVSLYTYNLSLSVQLYNYTIGIDKILINKGKTYPLRLHPICILQSLVSGGLVTSQWRALRTAARWFAGAHIGPNTDVLKCELVDIYGNGPVA